MTDRDGTALPLACRCVECGTLWAPDSLGTLQRVPDVPSEALWPMDVRRFAQAVELLERARTALDPDCYLDLCADIERFLND